MCCCKPDLPHDEAEKFKLHGKKEAWEKQIFTKEGEKGEFYTEEFYTGNRTTKS